MVDTFDASARSNIMRRVHSTGSVAEMRVRRALHAAGLRYRLHRKDLPGRPDIVFPAMKVAVFVHGCFWHRHPGCRRASTPASNKDYWLPKLERNQTRAAAVECSLSELGWTSFIVWECQTKPADLEPLVVVLNGRRAALRSAAPTSDFAGGG